MTRPKLGQNFLVSPSAPRAVVDALGAIDAATVVEIGPGRGAITGLLAARARQLIAVELDRTLAASLARSYAGNASVQVLTQDILTLDFTQLAEQAGSKLVVVGNLPYYITSDILLHLFAHRAAVDHAILMMQREVADRVTAAPGSRDYGVLSATVQVHAQVERLFTLPPEAFAPAPEVHSSVVRLIMRPRFAELQIAPEDFTRTLRQAFAQKRKTLANNLRAAGYTPAQVTQVLAACGIAPLARSETLAVETLACLTRALAQTDRATADGGGPKQD